MSDQVWGHAQSKDSERYTGAFGSRAEAIEDGREWYSASDGFWVMGGRFPKASEFIPDTDYLLELMSERASDEHGEVVDDFPNVTPEGKAELKKALAAWASEHVEVRFWKGTTEPERIDPLGS